MFSTAVGDSEQDVLCKSQKGLSKQVSTAVNLVSFVNYMRLFFTLGYRRICLMRATVKKAVV